MREAMLETKALAIGYPRRRQPPRTIASGIGLSLRQGELVCLLGPNGAGKSTFLRTVTGLQPPLDGQVLLNGRDIDQLTVSERARVMSVVLTERITAGMLTSYDIVGLGRQPHTDWRGRLTPHDHEVVRRCLDAVGARDLAPRMVAELSDGERQRVMVARALAQEPRLMVLDEITAFLDLPRRVGIMRLLSQLAHDAGMSLLVSTHDLDLAIRTADQLWLVAGDGNIQAGAPEDLVLDGAIERTFASDGLTFDVEDGAFRTRSVNGATVAIAGDGLAARWTARAVERAGHRPGASESVADLRIRIGVREDGRRLWELSGAVGSLTLHSAGELVNELRRATHASSTRASVRQFTDADVPPSPESARHPPLSATVDL